MARSPWNVTQMAASRLIASAVISIRSRSWRLTSSSTALRAALRAIQQHAAHRRRTRWPASAESTPARARSDTKRRTKRSAMPSPSKWTARIGGKSGRPAEDVAGRAGDRRRWSSRHRAASARWGDRSSSLINRPRSRAAARPTDSQSNTSPKWRTSDVSAPPCRHRPAGRARQRRHAAARDAAGHDQVEVIEIGRHVERKTVARDPARDAHANRTQFIGADPGARQPLDAAGLQRRNRRRRES